MRALVLAGGGSKGAYAVGVLDALCGHGLAWDAVIGCSTGALIAPSLALGDIKTLVDVYSNVTNEDIYRQRQPWEYLGHRSVYDSMPLWGLINRCLPHNGYALLQTIPVRVYLLTTHLQGGQGIYWSTVVSPKPIEGPGFTTQFIDSHTTLARAMFASASQPLLFPLVEIYDDHQQYCDGGVISVAPIGFAQALGADIIDVILLSPPDEAPRHDGVYKTFLETAARTLELLIESSTEKDLAAARASFTGTLHVIQPEVPLIDNSLRFNPPEMQQMIALGRIAGEVAWHEWGKET